MSAVVFGQPALAESLMARYRPLPADEDALEALWGPTDEGCAPEIVIAAELPARAAWYVQEADPSDALLAALAPVFWIARRAAEEWLVSGGSALVILCPRAQHGDVLGAAAVGALESLVCCIAREYGPKGARVNLVLSEAPLGAPSVAHTVSFLLSDRASFVSGERIALVREPPCR